MWQVPIALDLAEPRLDIPQRRGQPALPLIRVRPAIDLGTPLFDQRIDRLEAIRRFEGGPQHGKHP